MFPACQPQVSGCGCFPRVRGDVPRGLTRLGGYLMFSPRARGCSCENYWLQRNRTVFPACAGMFLLRELRRQTVPGFPRVRGDVP